jgi:hypothetical protein
MASFRYFWMSTPSKTGAGFTTGCTKSTCEEITIFGAAHYLKPPRYARSAGLRYSVRDRKQVWMLFMAAELSRILTASLNSMLLSSSEHLLKTPTISSTDTAGRGLVIYSLLAASLTAR